MVACLVPFGTGRAIFWLCGASDGWGCLPVMPIAKILNQISMKYLFYKLSMIGCLLVWAASAQAQCYFTPYGPDDKNQLGYGQAAHLATETSYTGVIYVVYSDSYRNGLATVMKYGGSNWQVVGNAAFSESLVEECDIAVSTTGGGVPYVVYKDAANGNKATVMRFNGTAWEAVGAPGFSAGEILDPNIAIDGAGVPYVSFKDMANAGKATVMKFDGTWLVVGTAGFSAGEVSYPSLALNSTGRPYLAYRDHANGDKATVLWYNGTAWQPLGTVGFTPGAVDFTSLYIHPFNNAIYIAYTDGANGQRASVMRFVTNSWVQIGTAGFSPGAAYELTIYTNTFLQPHVAFKDMANAGKPSVMRFASNAWSYLGTGLSQGEAGFICIGRDFNELPYVVYSDVGLGDRPMMKRYDGTAWATIGAPSLSTGDAQKIKVVCDKSGAPYVAYADKGRNYRITVKKYDGNKWVTLGIEGFSAGAIDEPSIALDPNGVPYVLYKDMANFGKLTMMRFNGTAWATVGTAGFTTFTVESPSMAIDRNGTPYVAFADGGQFYAATVMKFIGVAWVYVGAPGFTPGRVLETQIAIASNGTPFVAIKEEYLGNVASVMRFNGAAWAYEGVSGFSAAEVSHLSLAIDTADLPWVAYMDYSRGGKATVKKITNAGGWYTVGPYPGFSADAAYDISLAVDAGSIPYVAYVDAGNGYKATVMKFADGAWQALDIPGFSGKDVYTVALTLNDDGLPVVAYNDDYAWVKVLKEPLVSTNATKIFSIDPPFWGLFKNGCEAMATVKPADPLYSVMNYTTTKVWIQNTQPARFVKRHYEIVPPYYVDTAMGIVTLFFTQAEFDSFNAVNTVKLPAGPNDAVGKANLRIEKRIGASSDGSGLPHTYAGSVGFIDPPDNAIVWDSIQGRWELSQYVSGVGGFWVGTSNTLLFSPCAGVKNSIIDTRPGSVYQWQLNSGSGYTNIANNTVYSGAATPTLTIVGLATSNTGIRYRCVANGVPGPEYTVKFESVWMGNTSTNWHTASNWSGCGSVPDGYTDVVIPSGRTNYPVVGANTVVQSLKTQTGASVTLQTGAVLTIR
jgi:hypothetical protein